MFVMISLAWFGSPIFTEQWNKRQNHTQNPHEHRRKALLSHFGTLAQNPPILEQTPPNLLKI
jgi:hypothetical protein